MLAAVYLVLALATLLTSALSAVAGMGGGLALLGVMTSLLAAEVVVPVHGVVQLSSNGARTLLMMRWVHRRIFLYYIGPAVLGVFLGARWYTGSDLPWFRPAVGAAILAFAALLTWRPAFGRLPFWVFAPLGLSVGMVASLIGATGPLLAPFFLRDDLDRREVIGTKAAIQISVHVTKIPAFALMGFDYAAHWRLWAPLALLAIAGTWLGNRVLGRMSPETFRRVFLAVLIALSLHLLLF